MSSLSSDALPPTLLDRYIAGECSGEEVERLHVWAAAHPTHAARIAQLRDIREVAAHRPVWNVRDMWGSLARQIEETESERAAAGGAAASPFEMSRPPARHAADRRVVEHRSVSKRGTRNRFDMWPAVRIAAGLLAMVGISWFAAHQYAGARRAASAIGMSAREVSTRRGERATVDLADGTRVILAPESRLRIPAGYAATTGPGARDVELDGEAYFVVRHDAARSFRVRTANGVAEDLGTEFVVTAYPETRGMRVLVASGEIAIHRATRKPTTGAAGSNAVSDTMALAVLQPGEFAWLDVSGAISVQQGVDARRRLAWTSGRLEFVDTPLRDVLPVLQRWYDIDFRVADASIAAARITTTFDRKTVQSVVEAFEVVLHLRAERHGRVVTLSAR